MSSRFRRSLVLTTLLALLLGVAGAAAPVGLAANPPNTKVSGIDVDVPVSRGSRELVAALGWSTVGVPGGGCLHVERGVSHG